MAASRPSRVRGYMRSPKRCRLLTVAVAPPDEQHVVGWHVDDLGQIQPVQPGDIGHVIDIAYAPVGISMFQTGVEFGVARRRVWPPRL